MCSHVTMVGWQSWNLQPTGICPVLYAVAPGAVGTASIPITQTAAMVSTGPASSVLQVAIKCNQLGVVYLVDNVPLPAVLAEDGRVESAAFVAAWKAIPETAEVQQVVQHSINNVEAAKRQLFAANMFVMAHKTVGGEGVLYVTARAMLPGSPMQLLLELRFAPGQPGIRAFFRSSRADFAPLAFAAIERALSM